MAAFQSYGGVYGEDGRAIRWSCYATCPVYEVRPFGEPPPPPPRGRRWVMKARNGRDSLQVAVLVDEPASDFSQMLTQISPAPAV